MCTRKEQPRRRKRKATHHTHAVLVHLHGDVVNLLDSRRRDDRELVPLDNRFGRHVCLTICGTQLPRIQRFIPFLFLFLASVNSSSRSVCNSSRIKLCWRCRFKNVTDRPDGLSKKYSNLNVIGRSATPHFPSGTATATATASA